MRICERNYSEDTKVSGGDGGDDPGTRTEIEMSLQEQLFLGLHPVEE